MQAKRRNLERLRTPLVSATGVAANIYTHQLANIHRVLSDIRIRHLLADEVGLGKTVQALMILNALRDHRPDLRVLIIVPDKLVAQWRDEILTRVHVAPTDGFDDGSITYQKIRLAWEALLKIEDKNGVAKWSLSDIDPSSYDLLIIDELHRLRVDVQDKIVRSSFSFKHLLVLTATPAFQKPERHAQLFSMLEPERTAIARWNIAQSSEGVLAELSPSDDLSKWPEWATKKVVEHLLERDSLASAQCLDNTEQLKISALVHCAYRRVIRTRRIDFSGVLPRRQHYSIITEPLGAEIERQNLMWHFFDYLENQEIRFEVVALAKRVILSPRSMEKRVDDFRGRKLEQDGLLDKVKQLVHRSQGDSRLDALIDLLASIWRNDPNERVLVAAQDNPTVDYLFEVVQARLPLIGPLKGRVPLVAARIRQGVSAEAQEDLGGYGNETNINLEAFQQNNAQILFAPEAAQVGLNLQCARVLILYSVPWRPEEVEQWIGRLDRIGNSAAFSSDNSAKSVDVYTIVQRGLVDEKVVEVLKRFHVFERSVNLDGGHLDEVASLIEEAALKPNSISWKKLADSTESMANEDEVQELSSELRCWLPWSVEYAKSVRKHIDEMTPFPPVLEELKEQSKGGPRSWDRAFECMIKLLQRSGQYNIRKNSDEHGKFRTLWYKFGDYNEYGQKEIISKVIFSFGANPSNNKNPINAFTFISRRGEIGLPPRKFVNLTVDGSHAVKPLQFLSFGDPLHDELVHEWSLRLNKIPRFINLLIQENHKLFDTCDIGIYFIRGKLLDPASQLKSHQIEERTFEAILDKNKLAHDEKLQELLLSHIQQLQCAQEADIRWLRCQLPTKFVIDSLHLNEDKWSAIDESTVSDLLNPFLDDQPGGSRSLEWQPSQLEKQKMLEAVKQLKDTDPLYAKSVWSHYFPKFDNALSVRELMVKEEAKNAEELAYLELMEAESRLELARDKGNPAQIGRAESIKNYNQTKQNIIRALWAERIGWLNNYRNSIKEIMPNQEFAYFIKMKKHQWN